jgi:hypothetical protein
VCDTLDNILKDQDGKDLEDYFFDLVKEEEGGF